MWLEEALRFLLLHALDEWPQDVKKSVGHGDKSGFVGYAFWLVDMKHVNNFWRYKI